MLFEKCEKNVNFEFKINSVKIFYLIYNKIVF